MPLIPPIPPDAVDGELAEFYEAVRGMVGRVPNSVRTMAHAPFLAMLLLPFQVATQREWPGTSISGKLKEMVVIKTSHINECAYCYAHNTALGEAAGITHDQVIALSSDDYLTSDLFDARERAAIAWAEHMTRRTAGRNERVYAMVKARFSDAEIVELTLLCGLFNMINRINDSLGLEIEAKAEVERIKGTLQLNPAHMGNYLRWLADNWPSEFDTLNNKAVASAAAE